MSKKITSVNEYRYEQFDSTYQTGESAAEVRAGYEKNGYKLTKDGQFRLVMVKGPARVEIFRILN